MSFFHRSGIVNVKMVITEEKILSNIDKVQKLINPNSKKQIVQLEDDSYFKDLVESIKTYLLEYPKKKNFPRAVYKASYDLVEYATNQFEDNTRKIELLIRKREKNIKLGSVLRDATAAVKAHAKNWKEIVKKLATKYPPEVAQSLAIIGSATDTKSQEYLDACELIDAKVKNLEQNLHIEIDMERIEDRSKALSFIGIEIAEALKYIPAPADGFITGDNTFEEAIEEVAEEAALEPVQAVEPKIIKVADAEEPVAQEPVQEPVQAPVRAVVTPVEPKMVVPEPALEPAAVAAAAAPVLEPVPVEADIIKAPVADAVQSADAIQVNPVFAGLFEQAETKAAPVATVEPVAKAEPIVNVEPVVKAEPIVKAEPVKTELPPIQASVSAVAPKVEAPVSEIKVAFAPETKAAPVAEPVVKAEPIVKAEPVKPVVPDVDSLPTFTTASDEQGIVHNVSFASADVETKDYEDASSLIDSMIRDANLSAGYSDDSLANTQAEEHRAYVQETRFEAKPSLFARIKNSKFVKTIKFIMGIRIKLDYPALPEGRG